MRQGAHTGPADPHPGPEFSAPAGAARSVAVFAADRTGHITGWSAPASDFFHRSAADALKLTWDALFDAEMSGLLGEALDRIGQGQSCDEVLHVTIDAGRPVRLMVTCTTFAGAPAESVLLCNVSDMEQDRRVETRMAFVDGLMRNSPSGLAMIDEDLRYVSVNDRLAAMNGMSAQAHAGRRVRDVVQAEDDEAFEQWMLATLRTGEPTLDLLVSGRTAGRPDTYGAWSVSVFRLTGPEGQVLGLGGIVVDVTDRQTALLEASTARQRLALVNDASTRMGMTLEMPEIARELTAVAVPAFADLAVVKIREDLFGDVVPEIAATPLRLRRLAGVDLMNREVAEKVFRTHLEVVEGPGSLLYESMLTRKPILLRTITDESVAALAQSGMDAAMIRRSGLDSMIIAPFVAPEGVLGDVLFGRPASRPPMGDEDLKTAVELAARTTNCLNNALAYGNERRIAVALQRSMLPEEEVMPQPPGLEIAHLYRPSSRAAQVGGDWFDVIPLSGHRIALVVGDVMGHDIKAAANMGQLRTAMRTLARLDLEPVDLLTLLDETVQKGTTMQYATCVYAVCDTVTRECSIVSAGHPPPLLRHADGTTRIVDVSPGVPLGVASDPEFAATNLVLPQDSTLVLYTDGLVEHRGEDIDTGIENLRAVLAPDAACAQDLCERVAAQLDRSVAEDDLALLMARVPSGFDHGFARWTLLPRPESVRRARALVRQTLREWDLESLEDTTMLLVSELVTNAVRYADGEIELRLAKGGVLVCEVVDADVHVPRRRHSGPEEEGGRGLAIVGEYSRAWGTRPVASGKVVWFELALPRGEASSRSASRG
jgi:PAS domain S-box-containing protein